LQDAIARRYGFRGPFDPALTETLSDPIRREFLVRVLAVKTTEELTLELLAAQYPELLKSLFDVHGTALARVGGAKVTRIFERSRRRRADGIRQIYQLPNGQVVGVTD
jgi:hypothetical protein